MIRLLQSPKNSFGCSSNQWSEQNGWWNPSGCRKILCQFIVRVDADPLRGIQESLVRCGGKTKGPVQQHLRMLTSVVCPPTLVTSTSLTSLSMPSLLTTRKASLKVEALSMKNNGTKLLRNTSILLLCLRWICACVRSKNKKTSLSASCITV